VINPVELPVASVKRLSLSAIRRRVIDRYLSAASLIVYSFSLWCCIHKGNYQSVLYYYVIILTAQQRWKIWDIGRVEELLNEKRISENKDFTKIIFLCLLNLLRDDRYIRATCTWNWRLCKWWQCNLSCFPNIVVYTFFIFDYTLASSTRIDVPNTNYIDMLPSIAILYRN